MDEDQKETLRETCKSHTTKVSDREFPRAYPIKLSKRELEDLYYTILDNNVTLKQTINTQNEKIRQLSTKVQRLAALQKTGLGRNDKDCCNNVRALLREHKDIISEQKRVNDRLSEKNRVLNMRLCSAKQFLGKNSAKCNKCCLGATTPLKNSSTSACNVSSKRSATNVQTCVASSDIHKQPLSTKTIEVQTEFENVTGKVCNENKCRTLMEELKQKITALENELGMRSLEYTSRVSRLAEEVLALRQERAADTRLQHGTEELNGHLQQRLRDADTQCEEVAARLAAEQRKVSELETRLRAAELSAQLAAMLQHRNDQLPELHAVCESTSLDCKEQLNPVTQPADVEDVKCPNTPKHSDDSGYMEVMLLEEQKAVEVDSDKKTTNFESYDLAIEEDQVSMLKNINDYNNLLMELPPDLEPIKTGEMFEIKKSESHVLQDKAAETLYENASEPATSVQMTSLHKSSFNLPPATKGILEKSDDFTKGYKKDEKVCKNVSYEDVMSDTDDYLQKDMKTTKNTEADSHPIVGYSPSDDKHFLVTERDNLNDIKEKQNRTERRRSKEEYSPTNRSFEFKEERGNKSRKKPFKEKESFNKDKDIKVKEQIAKGKKNISIEVPNAEEEVHLCSKETNMNIDTCNSNPSTESSKEMDPSGHSSPKCTYLSQPTDKDDIKVIKDVKSNSDINVTKVEDTKPNEDLHKDINKKNKTKRSRNSIEQHIEKFGNTSIKQLDMCAAHATVCACPRAARREVRVFRTCSGTARFATVARAPPDSGLRQCACAHTSGTQTQKFRDGGTYIVRAQAAMRLCAAPAPPALAADTDGEISGLTDLPDEISVSSAARAQATCTATSADCTLSEGELPLHAHNSGRKVLSPGERSRKISSGEVSPTYSTSQGVEETLRAIGEELARCRVLLQRQRPKVKTSKDMSCTTEGPWEAEALALRRAEGQARIVAAHSHICHFTLHIGTLVLSDQAVLHSRGKSLMLTWRFYEQSAGLARVPPGRVAHFDLTTEYQLPFTEDFLEYMRNEDMCLKICEPNKMDEVFASCTLPLRDTLLHANRRADMSLPLVAGEEIVSSRVVTDALDCGDEAGVLDVWCQLRLDPALLAALRKGSTKAATMWVPAGENQSSLYHLPRELEANLQRNGKNNKPMSGLVANTQLTVRSSQEVRQAVANEIRPPSKFRVLAGSDSSTIYSLLKNKHWRAGPPKSSNGQAQKKSVTIGLDRDRMEVVEEPVKERSSIVTNLGPEEQMCNQTLDITVVWLALSEECEAMGNPDVQRLFVAYSFLGREGADLETPVSLPKPKSCNDKCYFNFNKQFVLNDCDLPLLGHLARCRQRSSSPPVPADCLTFAVVSEPPEDPLGLDTCEDIGFAHLYLGDVLARCAGSDSYTEVLSVHARSGAVCGVLAVRLAGLHVLRRLW